jgi:hypothetical protein
MAKQPNKQNGKWGRISYFDGARHSYDLWVTAVEQTFTLSGTASQSRQTKHFYPHGLGLGPMHVSVVCPSQEDYQATARFIRRHQEVLINIPDSERFTPLAHNIPSRLLTLSIPSEGIQNLGFIEAFTLTKKGVFDPAPKYTFDFQTIVDPHTSNFFISHALVKWSESNLANTGANDGAKVPSGDHGATNDSINPNKFNLSSFKAGGNFWAEVMGE